MPTSPQPYLSSSNENLCVVCLLYCLLHIVASIHCVVWCKPKSPSSKTNLIFGVSPQYNHYCCIVIVAAIPFCSSAFTCDSSANQIVSEVSFFVFVSNAWSWYVRCDCRDRFYPAPDRLANKNTHTYNFMSAAFFWTFNVFSSTFLSSLPKLSPDFFANSPPKIKSENQKSNKIPNQTEKRYDDAIHRVWAFVLRCVRTNHKCRYQSDARTTTRMDRTCL